MNIEDTKFIVEVSDYHEVNDYLQLGWVLVNQYVRDFGEFGRASQRPFFILTWQNQDAEPKHPSSSTFLMNQRDAEMWKSKRVIRAPA